jgi:hypothetical protein
VDRQEVSEVTTQLEFLSTVFQNREDDEHILIAQQKPNGAFLNVQGLGKAHMSWVTNDMPYATYVNVSTVRAPRNEEPWRRKKTDCVAAFLLVLDDIGTKVNPDDISVEPTYKLETSEGNFQWGYLLVPNEDLPRFEALVTALAKKGLTDPGAEGCNRVVRIPGSVNLKPGRNNFVSRLTEWEPTREWELDELAEQFDVNLSREPKWTIIREESQALLDDTNPVPDPLYDWLVDNGYVVSDDGVNVWATIKCPWADGHTSPGDTAGYNPLGRGDQRYAEYRAFKCFHGHCENRKFSDLMDWAAALGAPIVPFRDVMPIAQARYVYVGDEKKVADMAQRKRGGTWLWELEAWSHMNYHRINARGYDRPVLLKTAFLAHDDTRKVASARYLPGQDEIAVAFDQEVVNTYVPPAHAETSERPEIFLDHLDYLIPDDAERACFLDWLAYKIQNPDTRSYAVVLVAEDAFGIGRSWVGLMLQKALEGHVGHATLAQLIGKGTSADRTYNDWAAECQFLIVDEAKDVTREDFWSAYETFKQRIDTSPVEFRANTKYGKTSQDTMWFNALIFSNHADAMTIPEDDRRIAVFTNAVEKASTDYYERLHAALGDELEPRRVYWYLKQRDVSQFNSAIPPMTEAKKVMIEVSRSPAEEILEYLQDNLEGDLVTRKQLQGHVKRVARQLGFDGIENNPGNTARRIWRMIGSLEPGKKNGYRVTIDTERDEIRAVRGKGEWKKKIFEISRDEIVAQIRANSEQPFNLAVMK